MAEEENISKGASAKEGFMKRARGFMTAMGVLVTAASSNANTMPNNVENNDAEETTSSQTYAEADVSDKGKTYHIDATRSFEEEYNKNLKVKTVVDEELEAEKVKYTRKEEVEEVYNLGSGNSVNTQLEETAVKKRKSGKVKSLIGKFAKEFHSESGAVDRAMGHEYVLEIGNNYIYKDKFDRKGRYKKSELHSTTKSTSGTLRIDEVGKYDYNGEEIGVGVTDNYEVKKGIRASVEYNANTGKGNVRVSSDNGKEGFSADIVDGVYEVYNSWNGEKGQRIKVSGDEISFDSNDGKEYSRADIKRMLKSARSQTNVLIRKVTKGEIADVSEYLSTLPQYYQEGTTPSLGEYFDRRIDQRRISEESDKGRAQHNENVKNAKSITAQDIVNMRVRDN